MKTAVRVKEPGGAWRQLSVGQAVAEASEHLNRGDGERALALLEKAVHHAPSVPIFRYLLGIAQVRQKLYEPAISNLEKVVRSDERNVDYLVALGSAMIAERPLEAIPHLIRAVELGSKNPEAYSKLAPLLVDTQKPEEALRICDEGLAACGEHPRILESRGLTLRALGRGPEALECLKKAEAQLPPDTSTMTNMAGVLLDLGRVAEARSYLERACVLDPGSAAGHYNLGLALLLQGHYREGFREYEARWGVSQLVGRPAIFPRPAWDGSELKGRRILLHAEQGAGDAIQFVRYAEFVKARGGRVILLARAPLSRLLSWLPDCEIAALDAPLPAHDFHCPLLSLPRLSETDKDSIPPPAWFVIPSQMKQKWSDLLGEKTGVRAGIVWAGAPAHRNDRNRSFACRLFAPLLEIPQVEWFSLQVGPAAAQLEEPGLKGKIRDLAPELTDYAETAAAISQLDLVITADTSVAHLAGSLGTPVWMLTPFAPDWRWLLERNDSPWYPAMRLFRQTVAGDWESVMQSVGAALREWVSAAPADVPAPNEPARLAADFIPAGAHVLDFGCGEMALEKHLPPECRYTPCDIDRGDVPLPAGVTHIAALGAIERMRDWRKFLGQLRACGLPVVLSCASSDFTLPHGHASHVGIQDLCAGIAEAGFHLQSSMRADNGEVLLRIAPFETRLPVRRRVLVMSCGDGGDFGDGLGFQLIHSVMPAGAEVHYGNCQPWDVPPGEFDLLVLGVGDSVFHPVLTDPLLELVRRIPRSVGIFGTQHREGIDRRRMSELLDRLTVWFARSEEDLLLYGAGRKNAVHLGDWRISALPMTRWQLDETLHAGAEVRTSRDIRKYRSVVSDRIHPLLCALTSAERVAYKEQKHSGQFRALLLDVFGRTWPESHFFEFPREAVAAYRARTMRVMSGMPQMFSQLLEPDGPAR